MHDINDRFTALESIDADQLTAVTGGGGDDPPPSPGGGGGLGRKVGKGLAGLLLDPVISFVTRPPSNEFRGYMQYEMEARRSRLLSDAYRGGRGN